MTQHTPGPWHLDGQLIERGIGSCHVMAGDEAITMQIYSLPNARLIAAAPELLAILEKFATQTDKPTDVTNARLLIAKVRGGVW